MLRSSWLATMRATLSAADGAIASFSTSRRRAPAATSATAWPSQRDAVDSWTR